MFAIKNLVSAGICRSGASQVLFLKHATEYENRVYEWLKGVLYFYKNGDDQIWTIRLSLWLRQWVKQVFIF